MIIIKKNKILTPFNAFSSSFSYDDCSVFIFSAGVSGAYGIILDKDIPISYYYLLGLLNSSTLEKYLKIISTALRGKRQFLPIITMHTRNPIVSPKTGGINHEQANKTE